MNRTQRNRICARAQSRAKGQLCREHHAEYSTVYQSLREAGYRPGNGGGVGPKAQTVAQTIMSKRYPERYRALYLEHKLALTPTPEQP